MSDGCHSRRGDRTTFPFGDLRSALLPAPVVRIVSMIMGRAYSELVIVLFRLAEHVRDIAKWRLAWRRQKRPLAASPEGAIGFERAVSASF